MDLKRIAKGGFGHMSVALFRRCPTEGGSTGADALQCTEPQPGGTGVAFTRAWRIRRMRDERWRGSGCFQSSRSSFSREVTGRALSGSLIDMTAVSESNRIMTAFSPIKEVGRCRAAPLERFGRNQRRAHLLAPGQGQPKGIQRFARWEDLESWQQRKGR